MHHRPFEGRHLVFYLVSNCYEDCTVYVKLNLKHFFSAYGASLCPTLPAIGAYAPPKHLVSYKNKYKFYPKKIKIDTLQQIVWMCHNPIFQFFYQEKAILYLTSVEAR